MSLLPQKFFALILQAFPAVPLALSLPPGRLAGRRVQPLFQLSAAYLVVVPNSAQAAPIMGLAVMF